MSARSSCSAEPLLSDLGDDPVRATPASPDSVTATDVTDVGKAHAGYRPCRPVAGRERSRGQRRVVRRQGEPAQFRARLHQPGRFGNRGEIVDGWETRRRRRSGLRLGNRSPREAGHDHVDRPRHELLRRELPGVVPCRGLRAGRAIRGRATSRAGGLGRAGSPRAARGCRTTSSGSPIHGASPTSGCRSFLTAAWRGCACSATSSRTRGCSTA